MGIFGRSSITATDWRKVAKAMSKSLAGIHGRLAFVTDDTEHPAIPWLVHEFPSVVVIGPSEAERPGLRSVLAESLEDETAAVMMLGSVGAIVDVRSRTDKERSLRWQWLFYHVRRNGLYLTEHGSSSEWWNDSDFLGGENRSARDFEELSRSVDSVAELHGAIALTKRCQHVFKVKDENANKVIPARLPLARLALIETRHGGKFEGSTTVVEHGDERRLPPQRWNYHHSFVRKVSGGITMRRDGLALINDTVLPSSFRHARARSVSNPQLDSFNQEFGRVRDHAPGRRLNGSFYDLSSTMSGHFGHILTETVSKLWGWDQAKKADPDLRAIYRIPHADYSPTVERAIFKAYGITDDDIEWVHDDVEVQQYVWSSYLWQNLTRYHFHPLVKKTWERLRVNMVTPQETKRRIFVSRKNAPTNRACLNLDEVESHFAQRGFEIVYPETLPFIEQANTFGNAAVVAGFAGSGMFSMMFAPRLDGVLVLSHDSYTARNEFLYATALSDELHYYWSRAQVQHGDDFSVAAFHSPWEFDFKAHGPALDKSIARMHELADRQIH
ncbi:glycosyltransferase family 61 protein [Curtobacterium sp. B18]|uniref:glycosyltransferase family 61 protein n=1 Tax=Curtobacterium sp. B18 TaxID=95614 RepID=UPI0003B3C983|nr:glycosyltransferase 61 family protein [Curtobacterium sp. B18]